MKIEKVQKKQLPLVYSFLLNTEQECVQLCTYVKKQSENIYAVVNNDLKTEKDISGLLYVDGLILHSINKLLNNSDFEILLTEFLKNYLNEKKIKCINGRKEGSEFIKNILKNLGKDTLQVNQYKLMILQDETALPEEKLSCDDEIRRCTYLNQEELFDLQKKYITKEVAPQGKQVSDLEVSLSLKNILKEQLCFALYTDGESVAKANTNAIGWNWIQIGGVYTHPLYRRNGYAEHLVAYLCQKIQKSGKNVCLFVKEKNIPALNLYKKLGFMEFCSFEIVYY